MTGRATHTTALLFKALVSKASITAAILNEERAVTYTMTPHALL